MTDLQSQQVFEHIKRRMDRFQRAYTHVPLNRHDWDDITQIIMIHIANQWHKWRGGTWRRWVNIISRNQFKNFCRNKLVQTEREGYPISLGVKTKGENGEIVWERDLETPSPAYISLFYKVLDAKNNVDKHLFEDVLAGQTWQKICKKRKMSQRKFELYRQKQCDLFREFAKDFY